MDDDIRLQLAEQGAKIDQILKSVEKTRKYFMWTLIISVVLFVLPLISLVFILPSFIATFTTGLGGF